MLGFLDQDYYNDKPIWKTKLEVVNSTEIGKDTMASANTEQVKFSVNFFDNDYILNNYVETLTEVLGIDDIKEADVSDIEFLVSSIRKSTVAHELYHIRQKLTIEPSVRRSKRHKPEKGDLTKFMERQYVYKPNERSARAFEIRYLREKAKLLDNDSRKKYLLTKLIEQKTSREKSVNDYYTEQVIKDRKFKDTSRDIEKKLEEIRQKGAKKNNVGN